MCLFVHVIFWCVHLSVAFVVFFGTWTVAFFFRVAKCSDGQTACSLGRVQDLEDVFAFPSADVCSAVTCPAQRRVSLVQFNIRPKTKVTRIVELFVMWAVAPQFTQFPTNDGGSLCRVVYHPRRFHPALHCHQDGFCVYTRCSCRSDRTREGCCGTATKNVCVFFYATCGLILVILYFLRIA